MEFDWWTFAFQLINVSILIWLLGRFLFRPVADMIAARQDDTRRTLAAAEAQQRQAAKAEALAEAERESIAAERRSLMQQAREEAEALRRDILEKARKDADAMALALKADAARRAEEDLLDRQRRATDLAVVIAQRLVDNLPADGRIAGYADRLAAALADLTPAQRQAFEADLDDLRLKAARPLTETETEQALRALNKVFPSAPRPSVDVDPALIAGLELHGRHSVVHNSLRHDLARISEALIQDADI